MICGIEHGESGMTDHMNGIVIAACGIQIQKCWWSREFPRDIAVFVDPVESQGIRATFLVVRRLLVAGVINTTSN